MAHYEYKVVPAPTRGDKVRGVKQPEARFANAMEAVLNRMAEGGWEYVRAEMLPNEERSGLSRTTKEWRNLLIFRRERVKPEAVDPEILGQAVNRPVHAAAREPMTTAAREPGSEPETAPLAAPPAAAAAPVAGEPLVARVDPVPERGFAEAPVGFDPAHEDHLDRDDTAAARGDDGPQEPERETGETGEPGDGPIPFRPLRGWRDRS